ncbi:MAG: FlgO family outer membrane protein [Elusimicrobiota bacterium]
MLKKVLSSFVLCVFVFSVFPVNVNAAEGGVVVDKERVSLAVLNFKNDSPNKNWEYMGKAIPEIISTQLAKQRNLRVVERSQLDKALVEMNLGATGVIDTNTAQQVGKMIGAKAIVIGSITQLGKTISISSRLIDVATGEAITGASVKCENESELGNMVEELAMQIVRAALKPDEIDKDVAIQNASIATPQGAQQQQNSSSNASLKTAAWTLIGVGGLVAGGSLLYSGRQRDAQKDYDAAVTPENTEKFKKETQDAYQMSVLTAVVSAVFIATGGIILAVVPSGSVGGRLGNNIGNGTLALQSFSSSSDANGLMMVYRF